MQIMYKRYKQRIIACSIESYKVRGLCMPKDKKKEMKPILFDEK